MKYYITKPRQFLVLTSFEQLLEKDIDEKRRIKNAKKWSNIVGSKLYKLFHYPDQRLDSVPRLDIIQDLEKILKSLMPDIVYTHHDGDINHDHQVINHAVLTALRPMNSFKLLAEIRAFETVSSTDQSPYTDRYVFKPNFYIDIEKVWNKKLEALKSYKKELGIFPHPRSFESIEALAVKRGAESGLKKAEAFMILRKIWK